MALVVAVGRSIRSLLPGRWEVGGIVFVLLLRLLVVSPVAVVGDSMRDTFVPGDYLLVLHAPYSEPWTRVFGRTTPRLNDVVVFQLPGRDRYIKRVVGLAGDVVELRNGRLLRNGQVVAEPFLTRPATYTFPPTTVPAGHVFVLGDNRNHSVDSHLFGPVPLTAISGVVIARLPR